MILQNERLMKLQQITDRSVHKDRRTQVFRLGLVIFIFIWNSLIYSGSRLFTAGQPHYHMETSWDRRIPFLPWTVVIYFVCYIFWALNMLYACLQEKNRVTAFFWSVFTVQCITLICFLAIPTTLTRPTPGQATIFDQMIRFLYWVDAPDNLFPSLHCVYSWFSFIAVRGRENVSRSYQIFSLLFSLAVCIATLTTRQHVIVDAVAGVLLAEGTWFVFKKIIPVNR